MSAIFSYRPNTQKIHNGFKNILTPSILENICVRITGHRTYSVVELNDTYNKGRLIILNQSAKNQVELLKNNKNIKELEKLENNVNKLELRD